MLNKTMNRRSAVQWSAAAGFVAATVAQKLWAGDYTKPLENQEFTLASSLNLRRRSEASMRIDAAATQPVFGVQCHLLHTFVKRVK